MLSKRCAGKSLFSAVACVYTVAAGGTVMLLAHDLERAESDVRAAADRLGVKVNVGRNSDSLRISPVAHAG